MTINIGIARQSEGDNKLHNVRGSKLPISVPINADALWYSIKALKNMQTMISISVHLLTYS